MPAARTYRNHHLDSTRWDAFQPRDGDVVVASAYKAGTTWMQTIALNLIFGAAEDTPSPDAASPWLDFHINPLEEVLARLEAQRHRRVIKTHLARDGLPLHPEVRYVVLGRDPRDVFMSLWNHYRNFTPGFLELLNDGAEGPPLGPCPSDPRALWRHWTTRGWFPWESEGYPFWGNLHHTASWWAERDRPNVTFVHYDDLKADPEGEIARVATFLGTEDDAALVRRVAERTDFARMKRDAQRLAPWADEAFHGGSGAFIYKGTNGRWREVLDEDDLALHRAAVARVLPDDCAAWLVREPGPATA